MAEGYLRYWAKTDRDDPSRYHAAAYHCADVGAVAHELLQRENRFGEAVRRAFNVERGRSESVSAFTFLIALHDIGKFSSGFQSLIADTSFLEDLGTPLGRDYSLEVVPRG